jgi:hypothetical protein
MPTLAWAYPDFISYGYKACITCHFNGMGGGPLNDYGRALFATEITAADASVSEDQLSNESGFLGATEIPWWIRPGAKFRGMFLKSRLEDSKNSTDRIIPMQLTFSTAFLLDQRADTVIMTTVDYVPTPSRFASTNEKKPMSLVNKEYYLRQQLTKGYILYVGLMDKPYGIRQPDHTAFSRGFDQFGLNHNDQTHGVTLQMNFDKIELFGNAFIGNLNQETDLRQKGFSLATEYTLEKDFVVGASVMKSNNNYLDLLRYGLTTRLGFAKGKSIIAEAGFRTDKAKLLSTEKTGFYTYIQSLIAFQRGYNVISTYQTYKDELTSSGITRNKLGLGILAFPFKKTEIRTQIINDRTVAAQESVPDSWSLQAQVHLSW